MPLIRGTFGRFLNWLRDLLNMGKDQNLFDKRGHPISPGAARELDRAAKIKPPRPWESKR